MPGEAYTAVCVVKTTSRIWERDSHQRPPSSCHRSTARSFGCQSRLAGASGRLRFAREFRRADLVLTPLLNSAERKSEASRFMLELALDSRPRRPADLNTSLTNLKPASSTCDADGLEDTLSSFVGARLCTLDDSALEMSRHCYYRSC